MAPGSPLKEYFYSALLARAWLQSFIQDKMIPMTICKSAAQEIVDGIDSLFPADQERFKSVDMEKITTYEDLWRIVTPVQKFETVFSAEVQGAAVYFVSKKGIYDTNDLISRADYLFTDNVRQQMNQQATLDIQEAGKCLAFDLATAAGFHIARAIEGVLLDYLKLLCPDVVSTLKDSQRNLGNYIKLAKDNTGEAKVCNALDQFRELHRNPLIHPEVVLTVDDATTMLGIAQSTIVAMALEMGKKKR